MQPPTVYSHPLNFVKRSFLLLCLRYLVIFCNFVINSIVYLAQLATLLTVSEQRRPHDFLLGSLKSSDSDISL